MSAENRILTTVYLELEDYKKAKRVAAEKGISRTELFRNAIHDFFNSEKFDLVAENLTLTQEIIELKKFAGRTNTSGGLTELQEERLKSQWKDIREYYTKIKNNKIPNNALEESVVLKARHEGVKDCIKYTDFEKRALIIKRSV